MDYIKQYEAFGNWIEIHEISPTARLLWYRIFAVAYKKCWPRLISIDNASLMSALWIKSLTTLVAARDELIENGLIEFRKGKSHVSDRYCLVQLYEENTAADTTLIDLNVLPAKERKNIEEIIEKFNKENPSRKTTAITARIVEYVKGLLEGYDKKTIFEAFESAGSSQFLAGAIWYDFGWLVYRYNFEKLLSGNYESERLLDYMEWVESYNLSNMAWDLLYSIFAFTDDEERWSGWVGIDDARLMKKMKIQFVDAFLAARKELIEHGLIEFHRGNWNIPNRYKLVKLVEEPTQSKFSLEKPSAI